MIYHVFTIKHIAPKAWAVYHESELHDVFYSRAKAREYIRKQTY
jgi:hypothetical protein